MKHRVFEGSGYDQYILSIALCEIIEHQPVEENKKLIEYFRRIWDTLSEDFKAYMFSIIKDKVKSDNNTKEVTGSSGWASRDIWVEFFYKHRKE